MVFGSCCGLVKKKPWRLLYQKLNVHAWSESYHFYLQIIAPNHYSCGPWSTIILSGETMRKPQQKFGKQYYQCLLRSCTEMTSIFSFFHSTKINHKCYCIKWMSQNICKYFPIVVHLDNSNTQCYMHFILKKP